MKPHLSTLYPIRIRVSQNYRNKLNKWSFASFQVLQLKMIEMKVQSILNLSLLYCQTFTEVKLKFFFYFVLAQYFIISLIHLRIEFVEQHS